MRLDWKENHWSRSYITKLYQSMLVKRLLTRQPLNEIIFDWCYYLKTNDKKCRKINNFFGTDATNSELSEFIYRKLLKISGV